MSGGLWSKPAQAPVEEGVVGREACTSNSCWATPMSTSQSVVLKGLKPGRLLAPSSVLVALSIFDLSMAEYSSGDACDRERSISVGQYPTVWPLAGRKLFSDRERLAAPLSRLELLATDLPCRRSPPLRSLRPVDFANARDLRWASLIRFSEMDGDIERGLSET